MGTPASDSTDTKLCRSSRSVQPSGFRSVFARTARKDRSTLPAFHSVPTADAKTRPCSCQAFPAAALCSSRSRRWNRWAPPTARQRQHALDLLVLPPARTERQALVGGGMNGYPSGKPSRPTCTHIAVAAWSSMSQASTCRRTGSRSSRGQYGSAAARARGRNRSHARATGPRSRIQTRRPLSQRDDDSGGRHLIAEISPGTPQGPGATRRP